MGKKCENRWIVRSHTFNVGGDVGEVLGGDTVRVAEQRGLDDGEDVEDGAGEHRRGLQHLGPLDQHALVREVVIRGVLETHRGEVRGDVEVVPDAGGDEAALGGGGEHVLVVRPAAALEQLLRGVDLVIAGEQLSLPRLDDRDHLVLAILVQQVLDLHLEL